MEIYFSVFEEYEMCKYTNVTPIAAAKELLEIIVAKYFVHKTNYTNEI